MTRRHHCFNCGEDLGPWDRFSDRMDTCGAPECDREARDAFAQERDEWLGKGNSSNDLWSNRPDIPGYAAL